MKKLIFITIVAFCVSCSDDFVNIAPVGVLDTATYFDTEENADQAVIGLYDLMQHNYGLNWNSAYFVKMLPGDDVNAGGGSSTDQKQLQDIDGYTDVSIDNISIQSNWDLFYQTIALANIIINTVETGNLDNRELVLGEAKFIRAWCYFELTTMWGDVPLRLKKPSNISSDDFALPKSSRAKIYEQVEKDLEDAITGLPDKISVSQPFRVSKGAAKALLGKVFVFQEKYALAITQLSDVISNPAHDLEDTPVDVWTTATEFGKESLFELGYISTNGYDWSNFPWDGRAESNIHQQLMGPRGDGFFDVEGLGILNGWGFNLPTSKLIATFDVAGDVDRKMATIATEAEIIAAGGSVNNPENIWGYEGAIRMKYVTRLSETVSNGISEVNYSANWRLLRYAEVLLLAAEAYNKNGQDDLALIELNKVRNRAGLPNLSGISGNDLFEAIVDEKFLELAHEGQRFWDLVRWDKAATELAGTGYTTKNDLFPIPMTEIQLNTALSVSDQNPGY
ncbi:putative outer membrane starch-binding protein [Aquimarina sp. MAR_2010_214]|uniref:RagB/SusD family nutrient uptake outer membrane protein n=1 Tax=Aquimarina sp. MAR_2010_214 TaxID=1250026 RepID=UPI000C70759E|nr:RagB/SusD family nutrient uptake outer membrane protein [Aquimarina sp. MAR_2010_214]PKV52903.1 putative outer membrane starch-binding protein [Aquimarina sp. MAR_2010_214]